MTLKPPGVGNSQVYIDRLTAVESRVDGFRSILEFGSLVGSDATAMFVAADASGENIYVPARAGGWNVDGILDISTAGQRWKGDGQGSLIYQQAAGRMLFDVSADDAAIEDLSFAYPGAKSSASWSYAEKDSTTNALYNQDSTISRSAFVYVYGASRVKLRNLNFSNVYAAIRLRSTDRYVTRASDNEVLDCRFKDFEFGLLVMNQINPRIDGLHGRDTGGFASAPPHLIYCAGGGSIPSGVPTTGLSVTSDASTDLFTTSVDHGYDVGEAIQFPSLTGGAGLSIATTYYVIASSLTATTFQVAATLGGASINHTTNVTAGTVTNTLADTTILGGSVENCVDYNNPYSASFKFRNLRGTRLSNIHSYGAARGIELAYSSGVVADAVSAVELVRVTDQDTELPGDDSNASGLLVSYSADCTINAPFISVVAENDYTSGITVRDGSTNIRLTSPNVAMEYPAASVSQRAHYKFVGATDCIIDSPGWTLKGANRPVMRFFTGSLRNKILRPRGYMTDRTWRPLFIFDSGANDNRIVLDRELVGADQPFDITDTTSAEMWTDSGTGNVVTFTQQGIWRLRVRTTNATITTMTTDKQATTGTGNTPTIPGGTVRRISAVVTARDANADVVSSWTISGTFKRLGSATPTLVGALDKTMVGQDAGAAAWDVTMVASASSKDILVRATGAAATTIDWECRLEMSEAA